LVGTGVPRQNHRPAASHWLTLSHNVVSNTPRLSNSWCPYMVLLRSLLSRRLDDLYS
jgi:hypothetical protein